jgi:DNA-directed RNA polymerase subunit L
MTISFKIENEDVALVNALRRIVLSEIPNVAFDASKDINIIVNTCSLHNEFIAHRLSLIPICLSEKEIESFEPDKYKFVLNVKNRSSSLLNVTTKDFDIYDKEGKPFSREFVEKVFPKNPETGEYILITKLKPNNLDNTKGDALHLEAHASLGIARNNACWSPVSLCTFFNNIDEARTNDKMGVIERERTFLKNKYGEPCSFTFLIESECRMRESYIFYKALDVLKNNLVQIVDNMESYKTEFFNGINIIYVDNCTHTMGNFLQAMIYNMFVRSKSQPKLDWQYIGYYQPHPLENTIVFKIKTKLNNNPKKAMTYAIGHLIKYLDMFKSKHVINP